VTRISRRRANRLILGGLGFFISGISSSKPMKLAAALAPSGQGGYSIYRFGWIPDRPARTERLAVPFAVTPIPPVADLRPQMPPIYDQGQVGSCVSNAVAAAVQYVRRKEGKPSDFKPSRLFIYYYGRVKENSVASDSGLQISDAIGVLLDKGVPPEPNWQYDGSPADSKGKFPDTSRAVAPPRQQVVNEASLYKTLGAFKLGPIPNLGALKQCLADGFPFVFGFEIYKSFFDNNLEPPFALTHIPVPPAQDQPVGAHAVLAVGYIDDASKPGGGEFICRNSWGLTDLAEREVHDKGYFYLPYAYTQDPDLSNDFWTIRASN
jgi:C1A family cysteine protease